MNVYKYGKNDANIVLIQLIDERDLKCMEDEIAEIKNLSDGDFSLIAFEVDKWNKDLSPWKAPAVFGNEDFGDGAEKTLEEIMKYTVDEKKTYFIGGYSLAGLFALWSAYKCDIFKGVASASPSVWFPGFLDFVKENTNHCDSVYLSLGDKEEKTKNHVMAKVGDNIRDIHECLRNNGINTTLEWNTGGHFKDVYIRTAKGFAWLLNQ